MKVCINEFVHEWGDSIANQLKMWKLWTVLLILYILKKKISEFRKYGAPSGLSRTSGGPEQDAK